nr:hypothetical protein [Tanacetum cinerariifolium]
MYHVSNNFGPLFRSRRLALIDRKKVIITEDTVQEALHLDDDDESIDCLPNEEIFTNLERMGTAWKNWNEFSSSMASVVICLATGRKFNFSKYIFDNLVRNVDSSSKLYMYPQFLQLMIHAEVGDLSSHTTKYSSPTLTQKVFANMRRVGKGFSGIETPLFKGIIVPQQAVDVANKVAAGVDVDNVVAKDVAEPTSPSPTPTTQPPQPSQDLSSTSQFTPTPPPLPIAQQSSPLTQQQPSQPTAVSMDLLHTLLETYTIIDDQEDASKQGGIIADLDADKDVTLAEVNATKDAKVEENADVQGRLEKSQAQAYNIDLEHAEKVLSLQDDEPEPAELKEVKEKGKQDNAMLRYQALKRKAQKESQAIKNMIVYLKNMVGFKMDYFKGMSYDDIRLIFEKYFNSNVAFLEKTKEQLEEEESRALKRKTKSSEEKVVKKQKLDEEVEELKKHLQIMPNNDDDVYTEATPIALKVPVVDYEIHTANNKPYYKIIRADETHQLFLSFLSLLRNFDREDLEMILLVERRYLLTRLTLDQMLNNARLEVKEESEVSLELLRFVKRQQQEGYIPE